METGANLSTGLASVYPQAALAGSPGRPRCRGGPPHLLDPQASLAEPDHASGTAVGDDSQPVAKNGLRRPTIALTGDSATPQGRRDTTEHQPPITVGSSAVGNSAMPLYRSSSKTAGTLPVLTARSRAAWSRSFWSA